MRACIQRVSRGKVTVEGEVIGEIGKGFVILLGVATSDDSQDATWLANKIAGLRVFEDAEGKMNLGLQEVKGAVLVVSQFTLLGDCRKGRRPGFIGAAPPELAEKLYEEFVSVFRNLGVPVATGKFRAMMEVELVNDGPVTFIIDSPEDS